MNAFWGNCPKKSQKRCINAFFSTTTMHLLMALGRQELCCEFRWEIVQPRFSHTRLLFVSKFRKIIERCQFSLVEDVKRAAPTWFRSHDPHTDLKAGINFCNNVLTVRKHMLKNNHHNWNHFSILSFPTNFFINQAAYIKFFRFMAVHFSFRIHKPSHRCLESWLLLKIALIWWTTNISWHSLVLWKRS